VNCLLSIPEALRPFWVRGLGCFSPFRIFACLSGLARFWYLVCTRLFNITSLSIPDQSRRQTQTIYSAKGLCVRGLCECIRNAPESVLSQLWMRGEEVAGCVWLSTCCFSSIDGIGIFWLRLTSVPRNTQNFIQAAVGQGLFNSAAVKLLTVSAPSQTTETSIGR
jgi:hypothetical protein